MIAGLIGLLLSKFIPCARVVLGFIILVGLSALASAENIEAPQDTASRIRLDDTSRSGYSQVGDPSNATVGDEREHRNASVYGHIAEMDLPGNVKGETTVILPFNCIVIPDGRHAPMHAEIVDSCHAPSAEKIDVEGALESGRRARRNIELTAIGLGADVLLGGVIGDGLSVAAIHGHQKIPLGSG